MGCESGLGQVTTALVAEEGGLSWWCAAMSMTQGMPKREEQTGREMRVVGVVLLLVCWRSVSTGGRFLRRAGREGCLVGWRG